ncbi:MAG TPA: SIR2 family protein [Hyphomicrobium sp.]|nr:SIR2 family protein [Hyphomicrobium sp.]
MADEGECPCAICKNHHEFNLDNFLLDEIRAENVAIFAGSGISTESPNIAPHSLYLELAHQAALDNVQMSSPDVAQAIADKPDGRFHLMRTVQERFDYINKFRDLRAMATSFYRELATMPYFNTFITTNWDRYFEEYCAAKPFVYDADMRFWGVPRRKVLKVHGTIDDYSSIVATRSDYKKCGSRLQKSLVGAKLKEILATNTCLFIGYSLRETTTLERFFRSSKKHWGNFIRRTTLFHPKPRALHFPST